MRRIVLSRRWRKLLMRIAMALRSTLVVVGLNVAAVLFVVGIATDVNVWFVGAVVAATLSVLLAAWEAA